MKRTRKLILALVVVMSLLMAMAVAVIPASAASETRTYYLHTGGSSLWNQAGAKFVAYFWKDGGNSQFVEMKETSTEHVFSCEVSSEYDKVIFLRKSKLSLDWNNEWNRVGDIDLTTVKNANYCTINGWNADSYDLKHQHDYKDVVTPPSCSEQGYTTPTCFCGTEGTVKDYVGATGNHNYANSVVDELYEASVATCTNAATYYKSCKCGAFDKNVSETFENGSALGHNYSDGVCTRDNCGFKGTLYLKPTGNWLQANARFAAYFFEDTTNTWVDMTDEDGDGIYTVNVPNGKWTNVIFCRMNPEYDTNAWNSGNTKYMWNQTVDLVVPVSGHATLFVIDAGSWDKDADDVWSDACHGGTATCTAQAVCSVCDTAYGDLDEDNHSFTKYVSNNDATCTANGTETAECANGCGEKDTRTVENSVIPHAEYADCPHKAAVDGEYFESFAEALEAVKTSENKTLVLNSDVEDTNAAGIDLTGITIDLNGHKLTAVGIIDFSSTGAIKDSSEDKAGRVVVKKGGFIGVSNKTLPVCVAEDTENGTGTYVIADVKDQYMCTPDATNNKYVLEFRPSFVGIAHFDLFANGTTEEDITFWIRITRDSNDSVVYGADIWVDAKYVKVAYSESRTIRLTLTNATKGEVYTIQLVMKSGDQYQYVGNLGTIKADGSYEYN